MTKKCIERTSSIGVLSFYEGGTIMVESIKEYKQMNGVCILKVFCKPTPKFPEGRNFFYAPAEAIELVKKYTWGLHQSGNRVVITAHAGSGHFNKVILFHKELFKFYQGYDWQEDIEHINMVECDNTDQNLNATTRQQNQYNRFTKGYNYCNNWGTFRPRIAINSKTYFPTPVTHREDEACILQNNIEEVWLRNKLGTDYYMFDFKKYRRGSEDILDLERTGKISEEEAIYKHILKYANNAWYYLRYGLQDYYNQYHIPIPKYSLDTNGFMVHPITGQRLCPH